MYALLMAVTERSEEAVRFAKRALQWDPLSLDANRFLAYIYYLTRRYDEAVEQSRRLREKEPNYFPATWTIGMVAAHKGDYDTCDFRLAARPRPGGQRPHLRSGARLVSRAGGPHGRGTVHPCRLQEAPG